jgi:hypothetical protein
MILYRCETLFPTLREEHKWETFENKVLRGKFGSDTDEITGRLGEGRT